MRRLLATGLSFILLCACGGGSPGTALVSGDPVETIAPVIPTGQGHIAENTIFDPNNYFMAGDDSLNRQMVGIASFDITGIGVVNTADLLLWRGPEFNDAWAFAPLFVDHIVGKGVLEPELATKPALTENVFILDDDLNWNLDLSALIAADRAAGRTVTTLRFHFANPGDNDGESDLARFVGYGHENEFLRPVLTISHHP